jgi:hypothetical protein
MVSACEGPNALREGLTWSYLRFRKQHRDLPVESRSNQPLSPAITDEETRLLRHDVYDEFARVSQRPARLRVELVPYPTPVVDVVPPVTLLLGLPHGLAMAEWAYLLRGGFSRLRILNTAV